MASIQVGDIFPTTRGGDVKVIDYKNTKNILVEFQDVHRFRRNTTQSNLEAGHIKNPYAITVMGVGYLGEGPFISKKNGKHTPEYQTWRSMFVRCYGKGNSSYDGCTVSEEWHNFQTFSKWFVQQRREEGWALDKDLKIIGNKVYSPEACSFVPVLVNNILLDRGGKARGLPQGVYPKNLRYLAKLSKFGESETLGHFDTPEEASSAYKKARKEYILEVLNIFEGKMDPKIVWNLKNWEVK